MALSIADTLLSAITDDKMGFIDNRSNSVPNCTDVSMAIRAVWHLSPPLAIVLVTIIMYNVLIGHVELIPAGLTVQHNFII